MKHILFSFFILSTFLFSHSSHAQKQRDHYSLLWKISGNGLSKPSYLFGTMHLSDRRVFDFSDSVIAKIQECEGFALEVAPDSIIQFIAQVMLDKEEDTVHRDFKADLTANEYTILKEKLLTETSLDLDQVKDRTPKEIAKLLNSPTLSNNDKSTFLDGYLYRIALGEKKTIHGLEQASDQIRESETEYEEGMEDLREIIYASEYKNSMDKLIQMYYEGDIDKINQWIGSKDTSDLLMLIKRNQKMADRIQEISAQQTVFYAVGAAHLSGEKGLISLLRKKGYTLTKVPVSFTGQAAKYKLKPVDITWQRYMYADDGYSVSMPGKPIAYPIKEDVPFNMYVYPDLGTGIFYFTMSVKIPANNANVGMDNVMDAFLNNMFKTKGAARGFKRKNVVFKGTDAIEGDFYNEKDKMYGRVRILKKFGIIYFQMICSYKKDALKAPDNPMFFESLELIKPLNSDESAKRKNEVREYVSEQGAYKVSAAATLKNSMKEVPSENGIVNAYFLTGADDAGMAYCVVYYLPPAGLIVKDDSSYLDGFTQNLIGTTDPEIAKLKITSFNGYPARRFFKQHESGLMMNILVVLRGSRIYMTFVVGTNEQIHRPVVDDFFKSFQLTPFKSSKWVTYESKEDGLKWNVPGEVQIEIDTTYDYEIPYQKSSSAIDSCSGVSYIVSVDTYSPYYFLREADFIKKQRAEYIAETDSVLYEKKHVIKDLQGIEWIVKMKETHNQKRILLLPVDNKMVIVFGFFPPELAQSETVNQFFSSFTLTSSKGQTTLFKSKSEQLLKDLSSTDTTARQEAFNMLEVYAFEPSDRKLIYAELQKNFADDSLAYESTRAVLLSRLKDVEDSTTVPFIRKIYPTLSLHPSLQVIALKSLLDLKSKASKDTFVSLVNESIPDVEQVPYLFFESLQDSIALNAALYPDIFPMVRNTAFRYLIYRLGNALIDSNAIQKEFFISHLPQLLAFEEEDQAVAENYNVPFLNVWNGLTLLGYFTEDKNVAMHVVAVSHHKEDVLAFEALTQLVTHKLTVDPQVLSHFAAQNKYRLKLYDLLKENELLSLYPAKWYKQEYFAEADMYSYAGGYDDEFYYDKIQLINSKVITYKGIPSRFFLFKMLSEGEWYVGLSGPFDLDKKKVYSEGEATNSLYETLKSRSVNAHYEELLKEPAQ